MDLGFKHLIFIIAAEAVAACLFITVSAMLKNRKLQALLETEREKSKALADELLETQAPQTTPNTEYCRYLAPQLKATKAYHQSIVCDHEIVLDTSPNTPLNRRTAAFRYAILTAEKNAAEATPEAVNWGVLSRCYRQLFLLDQDFAEPEPEPEPQPTVAAQQDPWPKQPQSLRDITVEQYRIHKEQRDKALEAAGACAQPTEVAKLQDVLEQQARFIEESETCVEVLENELKAANLDLAELRQSPHLRPEQPSRIQQLEQTVAADQHTIKALKKELHRLSKKLESPEESTQKGKHNPHKSYNESAATPPNAASQEENILNRKLND